MCSLDQPSPTKADIRSKCAGGGGAALAPGACNTLTTEQWRRGWGVGIGFGIEVGVWGVGEGEGGSWLGLGLEMAFGGECVGMGLELAFGEDGLERRAYSL